MPFKPTWHLPLPAAASDDIFPNLLGTQFPHSCMRGHRFGSPQPAFVSHISLAYDSNLNEFVLFSFRFMSIPLLLWHLLLLWRVQVKEVTPSFLCLPGMWVLRSCFQVRAKSHKPLLPCHLLSMYLLSVNFIVASCIWLCIYFLWTRTFMRYSAQILSPCILYSVLCSSRQEPTQMA